MSDKEKLEKLTNLVKDMRAAQKEYFKTRNASVLTQSKRLEREVDQLVHQILTGAGTQSDFFTQKKVVK